MNYNIKKFIGLFLFIIIGFIYSSNVYASNTPKVTANYLQISEQNSYLVSVAISDNPGLMGFKLNVSYGEGVVINSVSRGNITEKGNFADNHLYESNELDILWNYTKEVKSDGELLILGITIEPDTDETTLQFTFSVEDTFNEKYEDVILECQPLKVTNNINTNNDTEKTTFSTENKQLAQAKKDNEKGIVARVIKQESLKAIIKKTIGESNMESLSSEEKKILVDKVLEGINEDTNINKNAKTLLKNMDVKDAVEVIQEAYEQQESENKDKEENNTQDVQIEDDNTVKVEKYNKNVAIVVIISAIGVLSIATCALVKKKGKKHEEM